MRNIIKFIIVIVLLGVIVTSFNQALNYSQSVDLKRVEDTISQLCLKCYSIEGRYPPDIEYLKENYGLLLNDEQYQVVYYYEGANLEPFIKVWQKEQNYE